MNEPTQSAARASEAREWWVEKKPGMKHGSAIVWQAGYGPHLLGDVEGFERVLMREVLPTPASVPASEGAIRWLQIYVERGKNPVLNDDQRAKYALEILTFLETAARPACDDVPGAALFADVLHEAEAWESAAANTEDPAHRQIGEEVERCLRVILAKHAKPPAP